MENENEKAKTTPRVFFLNLSGIATLYVVVVSLINLIFSIIDKWLPDKISDYYDPYFSSIRLAMAFILIIFPLHLFLMKTLQEDIRNDPQRKRVAVRKWLIYLTLFIAGVAISIDLVMLVNSFLMGELTLRFFLKVLTVFSVSYFVIKYYLMDIKDELSDEALKKFKAISIATVTLAIIAGFYLMGSPLTLRQMRFDDARIDDLQMIQNRIINFWEQKDKLPEKLSDLNDSIAGFTVPADPETKAEYGYEILSDTAFKLCATFNLENTWRDTYRYPVSIGGGESWDHKQGFYCFERNIDPELYPQKMKIR